MKKVEGSVEEMFAFVTTDPEDNSEGIIGAEVNGELMPLVGSDTTRIKELLPMAKKICEHLGSEVRIIKFTKCEEIGHISPPKKLQLCH